MVVYRIFENLFIGCNYFHGILPYLQLISCILFLTNFYIGGELADWGCGWLDFGYHRLTSILRHAIVTRALKVLIIDESWRLSCQLLSVQTLWYNYKFQIFLFAIRLIILNFLHHCISFVVNHSRAFCPLLSIFFFQSGFRIKVCSWGTFIAISALWADPLLFIFIFHLLILYDISSIDLQILIKFFVM